MKKNLYILAMAVALLHCSSLWAQQQFDGICGEVKIEILQELTLERIGFLATLEVTNNAADDPITDFSAALTFRTLAGDDVADQFFVKPPEISGTNDIDGNGVIPPTQTARVEWFIIPKIAAGGENPFGEQYKVGANLAGRIYGSAIPDDVLRVVPDTITVKPEPQLEITYFQPRDVQGDDPFTVDVVESPIPFIVGVLVKNSGFGAARSIKIASQQPRIVGNNIGVLLVAQLLGSRVDDDPTDEGNLTVNIGDLDPGTARKAAWDMITSLSGEFVEFNASYTHDSELGGEETSVIKSLNAYFIASEVLVDLPGRDGILDFLADTDEDSQRIPDTIFENNGDVFPVNRLTDVDVQEAPARVQTTVIDANANFEDWVYIRVDDPRQARFPIESIIRSDGKVLNANNYWTNVRFNNLTNERLAFLNILDFVELGQYQYVVTYGEINDPNPPVTTMRFAGQVEEMDGKFFILPETQIYFTVEDESPVNTQYSLDGSDFLPAIPFNIDSPGEHQVIFFSSDTAGNTESQQSAMVVVAGERPSVDTFAADNQEVFVRGDAVSVRPDNFNFQFQGQEVAPGLDANVTIYQGVIAFATLTGVPSTPTTADSATIVVGGESVDFYRYRLNGGAWSAEAPVGEPIALSELANNDYTIEVLGRSRHGNYLADNQASTESWTVNDGAAPTMVAGAESPSRNGQQALTVSGDGVTLYRYRINGSFFHAERPVSQSVELDLPEGTHLIEFIGYIDGNWQSEDNPTAVTIVVDHGFGNDFSTLTAVRTFSFANIGDALNNFSWDTLTQSGSHAPPGWYTVALQLIDNLGQSNSAVKLVRVGDMMADRSNVAEVETGSEKHPHAFGGWVVWQDQRSGDWDIYARQIECADTTHAELQLTSNNFSQEYPTTDGRWVVWQDRQTDGSWDIWKVELGSATPAAAITTTEGVDEIRPIVYWPWVVYQSREANSDAPWQLKAYNFETQQFSEVDPSLADQLRPRLFKRKVVWQDWRDAGPGEIYMKDLESGVVTRITNNPEGQFNPVIYRHWIVWQDTRNNLQNDLWAYNLLRSTEIQLTDTPENETEPCVVDDWVSYTEDSVGVPLTNLRLLNLTNLATIQLTNNLSEKRMPCMSAGRLVWQDAVDDICRVVGGPLPNLQAVYNNRSPVVVTEQMVEFQQDAFTLLSLWHEQAQVTEISYYSSLSPLVIQTATLVGGEPTGDNFALTAGSFLWIRFQGRSVLDVGTGGADPVDLTTGTNIVSACFFPDQFSSYKLIRDLGLDRVNSVRLLDVTSGRWVATSVVGNRLVGDNFDVPRVAVVMLNMNEAVPGWRP